MSRVGRRIAAYPSDPVPRSDKEALFELLKTSDFYADDVALRESLDEARLKVLAGNFTPRPLEQRLSGESLRLRQHFEQEIERSEEEVQFLSEAGVLPTVQPYWDPRLEKERSTRISFFKRLCDVGLGSFRRHIRGKIGLFFLGKKDGSQRMVVDARMPNTLHKRPPKTRGVKTRVLRT